MRLLRLPTTKTMLAASALTAAVCLYGWATRGKSEHASWEVVSPVTRGSRTGHAIAEVVALGNLDQGLVLVAGMSAVLLLVRPKAVWVPFVAFAGTGILVDRIAKPLFDHQLNGGLGYPSGHSSVLVAALVGFALCTWPVSRAWSYAALALAGTLPAFVWAGNYHRLSEVLAGAAVAGAAGMLTAGMVDDPYVR